MKLFENGIGRPSNETIRKRRTFYAVLALAIVFTVMQGTLLTSKIIELNKLKGEISNTKSKISIVKFKYSSGTWKKLDGNIEVYTKSVSGLKDILFNEYQNHISNESIFITNKKGNQEFTINVKNNNNFSVFYSLEGKDGKQLEQGEIKAKQTLTMKKTLTTSGNQNSISFKYSNNLQYLSNCKEEIYDSDVEDSTNSNENNCKGSYMHGDYYINLLYNKQLIYLDNEDNFSFYNSSSKKYYLRVFEYNNSASATKASLSKKTSCISVSKNVYSKELTINTFEENISKKKKIMKIYKTKSACEKDLYGISKTSVVGKSEYNLVNDKLPQIEKNNIKLVVNKVDTKTVEIVATTKNKTFKSCTLYNTPASYKNIIKRYPNAKNDFTKTKKVRITYKNLKPNTKYEVQCASGGKNVALQFYTTESYTYYNFKKQ